MVPTLFRAKMANLPLIVDSFHEPIIVQPITLVAIL